MRTRCSRGRNARSTPASADRSSSYVSTNGKAKYYVSRLRSIPSGVWPYYGRELALFSLQSRARGPKREVARKHGSVSLYGDESASRAH